MGLTVRWTDASGAGLEHLHLQLSEAGVRADSVVIGEGFAARYTVECDVSWRTRRVFVEVLGGGSLELEGDGTGGWAGHPELAGAVDVDLTCTPFTNTLPLRRVDLPLGEGRELIMVYVQLPSLAVSPDPQRYTRLGERTWRFESQGGDFCRNLEVDEHGLVLDYPGLFRRVGDQAARSTRTNGS